MISAHGKVLTVDRSDLLAAGRVHPTVAGWVGYVPVDHIVSFWLAIDDHALQDRLDAAAGWVVLKPLPEYGP